MPDLPGSEGVPSIFHFGAEDPDLAARALQVRRAGTDLIVLAGGQFIHPVRATVGGVTGGIPPAAAEALRAQLVSTLPLARELFERYWELFVGLKDRINTLGDDTPTFYLAAVEKHHAYYGGRCGCRRRTATRRRPLTPATISNISPKSPGDQLFQRHPLPRPDHAGNSLARLNMLPELGTPVADAYMRRFHEEWGHPAHAILLFDLARGIELVYGLERAIEILGEDLASGPLRVRYRTVDGEGCGLVEAPRGPLIHRYVVRDGLVEGAKFVIPTEHNILAIERRWR